MEQQFASKKALKEELYQKIEKEIIDMFSELDIDRNTDSFSIYALPYEVDDAKDSGLSFMLKLIFQQFNDETKENLIHATVKIIKIKLSSSAFKVMGPVCYKVDPKDSNILLLPFFLYYSKNNYFDVSKEVISPLLEEISPLTLL